MQRQAEETFPVEAFARLVELEANNFWFRSRNRIIVRAFRKYLREPTKPRVLEIGCGTGFVLSALHAERRFDLVGSEQHAAGLDWARRRLPEVEFVQLDARHLPYEASFDAVGAFDVIEHIPEDEEVMANVHRALRPKGLFILTVPQHAWLWSSQDELARHQRRYSRAELRAKLEAQWIQAALLQLVRVRAAAADVPGSPSPPTDREARCRNGHRFRRAHTAEGRRPDARRSDATRRGIDRRRHLTASGRIAPGGGRARMKPLLSSPARRRLEPHGLASARARQPVPTAGRRTADRDVRRRHPDARRPGGSGICSSA